MVRKNGNYLKNKFLLFIVTWARVALMAILLFPSTWDCFGQWITWERTYFYTNYTSGYCVKQTSDGNYIVCGARNYAGLVTKLNQYGDTLWAKYFPVYQMYSIVEGNDGNYVAIGNANDLYIVKISPSGNVIWTKLMSEPGYEIYPLHINKTNDNNLIVVGKVQNTANSAYYIKLSNNGDKIWSKIIGSVSGISAFQHVQPLSDGGYIFTGGINILNNGQIYLVRTDSNGDTIWTKGYGSVYNDYGHSVVQTDDKGFLVLGNIWYSNQEKRLYLLKTDSTGNLVWSKIYGDTSKVYYLEYGDNFAKLKYNNTYLISGFNVNFPTTEFDTNKVFLLNIDLNGNRIWEKLYKKDTMDVSGISVDVCNDSGFIISGNAKKLHTAGDPTFLYTIKTNKFGEIIPIAINNHNSEIPNKFKLHKCYPNPFNSSTIIEYEIPKVSLITIKVYNALGIEIQILTNRLHAPGTYKISFNANNISSGLYFVRFTDNDAFFETQKIILLK